MNLIVVLTSQPNSPQPGGSFSVDVLRRILLVLSEQGSMRKTNLAGKTGLNYLVCLKYISFMKMLRWITITNEEDIDYIAITTVGRQLIPVFTDYLCGKLTQAVYDESLSGETKTGSEKQFNINPVPDFERSVRTSTSRLGNEEGGKSRKNRKILLVDDEPDALLTYKSFLAAENYIVDDFEDPERAFMRFASMKPGYYDLIITDIRMMQMNGLVLYQRIKALDPFAKVIFVTALDAADELVTILSPQPATILRKPIEQDMFNSCVNSIISS